MTALVLLATLPGTLPAGDRLSTGPGAGSAPARPTAPQGDSTPAPLIVVSFDGFRCDYPGEVETPKLDALAARGVRAEQPIPVFPGKTFPAHYSIATGLDPGHHGILSNNMTDPRWPETFGLDARDQVQDGRWWGGEPIWVNAELQGIDTAAYFWPGSEAPVQGVRPGIWFPYDGSVGFEERIETALGWLDRPAAERVGGAAAGPSEPGREVTIHRALAGSHPHLRVWRRDEIPPRLGLHDHRRLPPILASPDAGWEVLPRDRVDELIAGDHGQDPRHPDMHGIFYAAGPDLASGVTLPALEQVDLYHLMARLLRIEPAPNDRDPARMRGLLR